MIGEFHPCPKPASRLTDRIAVKRQREQDERDFRAKVWRRDKICRKCQRAVLATIARVPNRREVHHVFGRIGLLRYEVRAALGVCLQCHEQLTGKVNERWTVYGTATFALDGRVYLDTRQPMTFRRVA